MKFRVVAPTIPWQNDDIDEDEEYDKMDAWCAETFARGDWDWILDDSGGWTIDEKVIYRFTREKDALWFKLRWA